MLSVQVSDANAHRSFRVGSHSVRAMSETSVASSCAVPSCDRHSADERWSGGGAGLAQGRRQPAKYGGDQEERGNVDQKMTHMLGHLQ